MPEWLLNDLTNGTEVSWHVIALRMVMAVVGGFAVAGTYAVAQRRVAANVFPFGTTLVLLTILVAMTALVIGQSVARAFSLVGALSIVRFRTVVDDTRDTAFVIYAVVVGMAVGSGQMLVCLIGIPVVSAVAIGLSRLGPRGSGPDSGQRLEIRIASGHDPVAALDELFQRELLHHRVTQLVTARQGLSLDLRYDVRLRNPDDPLALVRALQQIEGIQSVEWREG